MAQSLSTGRPITLWGGDIRTKTKQNKAFKVHSGMVAFSGHIHLLFKKLSMIKKLTSPCASIYCCYFLYSGSSGIFGSKRKQNTI